MRFMYRMPWSTRVRIRRTLGLTVCVAGALILLVFLPPWIWGVTLGVALTIGGLFLLSLG